MNGGMRNDNEICIERTTSSFFTSGQTNWVTDNLQGEVKSPRENRQVYRDGNFDAMAPGELLTSKFIVFVHLADIWSYA